MIRYTLAWVPMVVIAVANGALREFTYGKHVPELRAHQLSTLTALLFFGIYIFALTRLWRLGSPTQALAIGLIWLVLTLSFEFLFGHYVAGHSWERLLQDYNLFAGRVWVFVPAWIAIAPYVCSRL